jgi:hypothetical protein
VRRYRWTIRCERRRCEHRDPETQECRIYRNAEEDNYIPSCGASEKRYEIKLTQRRKETVYVNKRKRETKKIRVERKGKFVLWV